jgi:hypothetical protein
MRLRTLLRSVVLHANAQYWVICHRERRRIEEVGVAAAAALDRDYDCLNRMRPASHGGTVKRSIYVPAAAPSRASRP